MSNAMGMTVNSDLIATNDTPLIVGLGDTGLSCARHFKRAGLPFAVVDSRETPPGLAALREECPEAELVLGELPPERLQGAGRLVVSPGVGLDQPAVAAAIAAGVPVLGDIDLFVAAAEAPVVGITGSNGKSTVTELLGRMARRSGLPVGVGGNLGPPALDLLQNPAQLYVLELSSFQLERAGRLDLAVACNLNMSADHLDRHGDMQTYHAAKHRIFQGCGALAYNRDDALSQPLRAASVPSLGFGLSEPDLDQYGLRQQDGELWLCRGFDPLLAVSQLGLAGLHNAGNALACLALGELLGLDRKAMLEELQSFTGLAHRCQPVAERSGVRYLDDSKATNPGATRAALEGLRDAGPLVLIAGGQGKGADFTALADDIARHCKGAVLLGEDADLIERALADRLPVLRAASMEDAVSAAADLASPGDSVLLSPACASFDMFTGFAERGDCFAQAVQSLGGERNG